MAAQATLVTLGACEGKKNSVLGHVFGREKWGFVGKEGDFDMLGAMETERITLGLDRL